MQTVRISSKRQITIPSKIFNELGIAKGDHLLAEKKGESILLTPAEVLVRSLAGAIKSSKKLTDEELEKIIKKSKKEHFKRKYKK
ncbi:AbrB/MazE/SpoVT family DNA-binding domain-containing protein [Candidatus Roizmanbacteria bacterium]|nr:AbrB/MazE/SpoVT family DNA-binding domain-containing protein [Candidatus Roizmanbacteria bacterium]